MKVESGRGVCTPVIPALDGQRQGIRSSELSSATELSSRLAQDKCYPASKITVDGLLDKNIKLLAPWVIVFNL